MKAATLIVLMAGIFALADSGPAQASEGFAEVQRRAVRDVHQSVSLTPRQQAIVQTASLSAIGANDHLKQAVQNALTRQMLSQKDVILLITQLTSYYGFPRADQALEALSSVIDRALVLGLPKDDQNIRHKAGKKSYSLLDPNGYETITGAFGETAPHLPETTFPMFADAYSPEGLSLKDRQLATISALTAMGTADPQLRFHIRTSLHVGLTQKEITDMVVLIQYYAGMPAAYNGALAAKAVFQADRSSDVEN